MSKGWSTPLTRPVAVIDGPTFRTLRDVRAFVSKLPKDRQGWRIWRYVAATAREAATGGDVLLATVAVELALMFESAWDRERKKTAPAFRPGRVGVELC